jgi:hypothetical protein
MTNNMINMEQNTENEFFKGARPGQRRSVRSDADGIAARLKGTAYYGWYKTLRASESYKETCRNKGEGRLAPLYEDFGDVYMPWDMWAARYGRKIFSERQALPRAEQIRKSDIENMKVTQDTILLNVPLTISRVTLMRQIGKIIKANHDGRKLDVFKRSTAKRPLLKSRVQMPMVEMLLEVMSARTKNKELPLWKVGELAGVKIAYMSRIDDKHRILSIDEERRRMAIVTSGYLAKARWLIDNAESGLFPLTRKPTSEDYKKARLGPPK